MFNLLIGIVIGILFGYFGHALIQRLQAKAKNEMDDYLTRGDG